MLTAVRTGARGQDGQALVAVLVIMTLVFGIAGALVTVASALLTQERAAQPSLTAELTAASVINGALAQVGDQGAGSVPVGGLTPLCLPAAGRLPTLGPVLGVPPAACLRVDNVSTATGDLVSFSPGWSGAGCSVARVPAPTDHNIRLLVWFLMRSSNLTVAWLTARTADCGDSDPAHTCAHATGYGSGAFGAAFDCDRSSWPDGDVYLHVVSRDPMPRLAWWAKYAPLDNTYKSASVYALAVPTAMAAADIEELHVLVPSDARPGVPLGSDLPTLLWRAPLP